MSRTRLNSVTSFFITIWFSPDSSFDSSDGFEFLKISVSFEQDCVARFNSRFLSSLLPSIITLFKNFKLCLAKNTVLAAIYLILLHTRAQRKTLTYIIKYGKYIFFFLLFNDTRSGSCFYMVVCFYFIVVLGFYYLFLLGTFRFCSVPTRFMLYYVRNFDFCAVIFITPTIKKTKQNNTEQKNPVL